MTPREQWIELCGSPEAAIDRELEILEQMLSNLPPYAQRVVDGTGEPCDAYWLWLAIELRLRRPQASNEAVQIVLDSISRRFEAKHGLQRRPDTMIRWDEVRARRGMREAIDRAISHAVLRAPAIKFTEAERTRARDLLERGYVQVSRKYRRVARWPLPNSPMLGTADIVELTHGEFEAFRALLPEYEAKRAAHAREENDQRNADRMTAKTFYARRGLIATEERIEAFADGMAAERKS